jgi:hypothetical protein
MITALSRQSAFISSGPDRGEAASLENVVFRVPGSRVQRGYPGPFMSNF